MSKGLNACLSVQAFLYNWLALLGKVPERSAVVLCTTDVEIGFQSTEKSHRHGNVLTAMTPLSFIWLFFDSTPYPPCILR